jgi:hypothetical protein
MKSIILATVAALSLGLAGTASATTAEIGPQISKDANVAQAGCYYQYFYVSNGYQYRYAYRWICY